MIQESESRLEEHEELNAHLQAEKVKLRNEIQSLEDQ